MQKGRFQPGKEVVGRAEILLRLTGETDDHVDADEGVGHQRAYGGDPVGEARRGITAAHQPQDLVRTALQGDVEMMLEFRRSGAEGDDLVRQKVRFDGGDAVTLDPVHAVQRPQQVDELLARRPAEIPRVDARQDDLLLSGRRDPARLGDQIGDRHVPAAAASVVDRTVCALVVAAVLHLEEGPRAVAARKGREERCERIGIATVNLRTALARQFEHTFI